MPVTLKDVAQKLDLSITTVSRALAGYSDVAAATRQRVLSTAEEMGYVPNVTARHLRQQRTDTIGFIIPSEGPRFSDPFFNELMAGLGNEAAAHEFDVLVSIHVPGVEEEAAYRRMVYGRRVDGVVIVRIRHDDWRIRFLQQEAFPFVCFGRSEVPGDYPYIGVDGTLGMYLLTRHFIESGHQRIAYIAAPPHFFFATDRKAGFRQALAEAGIPLEKELEILGDLTQQGGYLAMKELLSRFPSADTKPTAIAACNDLMALGAMAAIQDAGLDVGEDIAVGGFDDIPPAAHSHPPLTTVRQPIYQIGAQVMRTLVQLVQHEPLAQRHIVLEPELVIRKSG